MAEVVGVEQGIPPWAQEIRAISERLVRIEAKLDNFGDLKRTAYAAKETAEDAMEAVRDLQDDRKWLWRAVVGTWVAAIVEAVLRR